jgi:hypothetical protein
MLDIRARPAGFAAALSLPAGDRRRFAIKRSPAASVAVLGLF